VSIRYKRYIPVLVADMLHTGEQIGGFTSSCRHIADIYTSDTNDTLQKISQFIEPVLMLFMGITVGSIALSIILPIYEITNHLSK
jgi:type II secretory pathway component PulF